MRPPCEPKFLLRNSDGKRDGMFTLVWLFSIVVAINALIGMFAGSTITFATNVFDVSVVVPGFEWETIPALLTVVTGYVIRRNKSSQNNLEDKDE